MIHFAWPWMLLLLPLPWLLGRLLPPLRPQGAALFLPFAAGLPGTARLPLLQRAGLRRALLALIWLLLLLAAVRPQWLDEPQPVPSTGRRLLLAVDVSGSMRTPDMANGASRLDVVKQVAGEFIRRRHGDQVGLILFGTQPYLQAPLTSDLATAGQFLQDAAVGIAGPQTAIGDAIGLAIKRLRGSDGSTGNLKNTVLILLTDGASNAGLMDPVQAAKAAAQAGLRIYTIGVGAAYRPGFFGGGNSDLDETTLQTIASASGGRYFRATDAEALESVYGEIDRLEPAAGAEQWYRPTTEWFHWPLGLALLLSLPAVLLRGRHDA
jgi:Ca-activated chloride channel family protein